MTYLLAIILGAAIGVTAMALLSYNDRQNEAEENQQQKIKTNDKCQE